MPFDEEPEKDEGGFDKHEFAREIVSVSLKEGALHVAKHQGCLRCYAEQGFKMLASSLILSDCVSGKSPEDSHIYISELINTALAEVMNQAKGDLK